MRKLLLQEIYYPNEWKIFVCCIMLNQTTGTQVHQVIKDLFRRYPNPKRMSEADPVELAEVIRSCGLYNRRAAILIRMSNEFRKGDWLEPKDLYGLGQYAQESWRIFIRGEVFTPHDKELKKYIEWKRTLLMRKTVKK